MKTDYCVYKHTSPRGKVYIGITGQRPEERWQGGLGYRHNEYFFRAILKYGWENFKHEILHTGLSKDEACAAEVALIASHRSTEKAYGYNITGGGETFKHSPESIQKMRENRKGKGMYPRSAAARQRISEHHAGGTAPVKVVCLTTGKIYASINDAARDTGVDKNPISRCCRGVKHYNTAGGLRWSYYNEQEGQSGGSL